MTRSFVIERETDPNESEMKTKIREEMIQKLASEWNEVHQRMEERSWRSEDERSDEADYYAMLADDAADNAEAIALKANPDMSEDELKAVRAKSREDFDKELSEKRNESALRLSVIEELLGELGARMARPYEHWNEDEKYMEYMETRHDNDERY